MCHTCFFALFLVTTKMITLSSAFFSIFVFVINFICDSLFGKKNMQMGPVGKPDPELDEETIASLPLDARKMHTFEHIGSLAAVAQSFTPRKTRSRLLMSIYTVLIKAKINVLLPFGPLAVVLHYLIGKQV